MSLTPPDIMEPFLEPEERAEIKREIEEQKEMIPIYEELEKRKQPGMKVFEFIPEVVNRKKPNIVTRQEWGAVPPKQVDPSEIPFDKVFFTMYSETPACLTPEECSRTVKDLQTRHMDELGLSDIKYNFLVGGDGNVYEGRGWQAKSSKSLEFNPGYYHKRLDICYIGDFRHVKNPPYPQLELALDFLAYAEHLKFIHALRYIYKIDGDKQGDWSQWPYKTFLAPEHDNQEVAMLQTVNPQFPG